LTRFLKEHWLLVLAIFLLFFMSVPLCYFSVFSARLDPRSAEFGLFAEPEGAPRIGICLNDLAELRWTVERAVWSGAARERRIPIQIRIAHHSLERQIRQIRYYMAQRVRVLILVPVSRDGLRAVLQEASGRGMKILLYDELTLGPADFYYGIDYHALGREQAAAAVAAAGPGNYLLFRGPADSEKADWLAGGQLEALRQAERQPVRLQSTVELPRWSAEQAAIKARSLLIHQKIRAILTPSDLIAEEIGRTLAGQQPPYSFLAGLGAEPALRERIKAGGPALTLQVDYAQLARAAFDGARQLLNGGVPAKNATVGLGSVRLPAWLLRNFSVVSR
jgi:ABC-type xylose transport system substrate-binding protein